MTTLAPTTDLSPEAALERALIGRPSIALDETHSFVLPTIPMDPAWIERFDAAEASRRAPSAAQQTKREALALALTAFGGQRACIAPFEEDLDKIMRRGRLLCGKSPKIMRGLPSRCHANVSRLYETRPGAFLLSTGYALSTDGMWRQHSWGFCLERRTAQLVETTVSRIAYFGYVMSDAEARNFVDENL